MYILIIVVLNNGSVRFLLHVDMLSVYIARKERFLSYVVSSFSSLYIAFQLLTFSLLLASVFMGKRERISPIINAAFTASGGE